MVNGPTEITTRVAGVSFRQSAVALCNIGDRVRFISEPENEFDQHALRVEVEVVVVRPPGHVVKHHRQWLQVGYVPKEKSIDIRYAIEYNGYKDAVVSGIKKPDSSKHVGMRVKLMFA